MYLATAEHSHEVMRIPFHHTDREGRWEIFHPMLPNYRSRLSLAG